MHSIIGIKQKTWYVTCRWEMHSTVGVEREAQSTNSGREMSLTALNIKGETLYVDY